MKLFSGANHLPCLVLHGGAGRAERSAERQSRKEIEIEEAAKRAFQILRDGGAAQDAVMVAVRHLEDCPLFNAGKGAALQSDGVARLTASFMDGTKQSFSSVSLAENVIRAADLAKALQTKRGRNLGPPGVERLIQELETPRESPLTDESVAVWKKSQKDNPNALSTGTVGAVAVDIRGRLFACTSTGGYGLDTPGRLSDVCTVAGNYASTFAAISCTGVGEQIIDSGVAVRIETRVRDGMKLKDAATKTYEEAKAKGHQFGWIGVDKEGEWVSAFTAPSMIWAVRTI